MAKLNGMERQVYFNNKASNSRTTSRGKKTHLHNGYDINWLLSAVMIICPSAVGHVHTALAHAANEGVHSSHFDTSPFLHSNPPQIKQCSIRAHSSANLTFEDRPKKLLRGWSQGSMMAMVTPGRPALLGSSGYAAQCGDGRYHVAI